MNHLLHLSFCCLISIIACNKAEPFDLLLTKGSIEVGKLADFTVFSENIMEIPEEEILSTNVVYTIIGGVVYKQE